MHFRSRFLFSFYFSSLVVNNCLWKIVRHLRLPILLGAEPGRGEVGGQAGDIMDCALSWPFRSFSFFRRVVRFLSLEISVQTCLLNLCACAFPPPGDQPVPRGRWRPGLGRFYFKGVQLVQYTFFFLCSFDFFFVEYFLILCASRIC